MQEYTSGLCFVFVPANMSVQTLLSLNNWVWGLKAKKCDSSCWFEHSHIRTAAWCHERSFIPRVFAHNQCCYSILIFLIHYYPLFCLSCMGGLWDICSLMTKFSLFMSVVGIFRAGVGDLIVRVQRGKKIVKRVVFDSLPQPQFPTYRHEFYINM